MQHMAGEEDGLALGGQSAQQIAHLDDAGRVQAVGRLIQDQQLGIVQQGDGQPQALLHPQRIGVDPIPLPIGQADQAQDGVDARLVGHAEDRRHRAQIVAPRHVQMQRGGLDEGADARQELRPRALRLHAKELDAAAGGGDQAEHHADGGGLAGAVRPQKADDLAAADFEAELVDRQAVAVALREVVGGEHHRAGAGRRGGGNVFRQRGRHFSCHLFVPTPVLNGSGPDAPRAAPAVGGAPRGASSRPKRRPRSR